MAAARTQSGVAVRARRTPTRSRRAREPAIWFALPAIVVYLVVVIYPSLAGAVYAFTDWSGIGGAANWVGLDNFKRLFTDDQSFGALRNTRAADDLHRHRAERRRARARARRPRPDQEPIRAAGDLLRARGDRARGDRVPVEVPPQPQPRQRHQRAVRVRRPRLPAAGLAGRPEPRALVRRVHGGVAVRGLLDGHLPRRPAGRPARTRGGGRARRRGALAALPARGAAR